ncbi:MAG TPA: DMT family transporter [Gemmatimonadaceae bacterium]|nr:DMT family transporter [Gemmatimonadaceae bacterium]
MGSTVGETVTPGHASSTRPGVWLTDALLVLMAVIWGANYSVVKYGTNLVEPLAYNGVRTMLAAVVLAAVVFAGKAMPSRRDAVALLLLGVLGNGIYQYLFVEGIARTRASDAALVVAASPALIAIVSRIRGVDRLHGRGILGIVLSALGIGFVVLGTTEASNAGGANGPSVTGDFLVLAGSACWAVYSVLLKPYTERVSGMQLSALTMIGGAVPLFVVAWPSIARTSWRAVPVLGWSAVLYSGIFSLVVAYLFWYRGIRVLGPTRSAMYSNLQPIFAVLVAWALLGEVPTAWQGVGAAGILGGLVLTRA